MNAQNNNFDLALAAVALLKLLISQEKRNAEKMLGFLR